MFPVPASDGYGGCLIHPDAHLEGIRSRAGSEISHRDRRLGRGNAAQVCRREWWRDKRGFKLLLTSVGQFWAFDNSIILQCSSGKSFIQIKKSNLNFENNILLDLQYQSKYKKLNKKMPLTLACSILFMFYLFYLYLLYNLKKDLATCTAWG